MRQRLDQLLLERGLVQSRARAADLIRRGAVNVGGEIAYKPGQLVQDDAELIVDAGSNAHVARSGAKLMAALQAFALDPSGRVALDVGASTGGFTQVLLEAGAAKVYAVDVGREQLHESLRTDPRVTSLEGHDARALTREVVREAPQAIVADVSFISLRQVLPVPLQLAAKDCWLVALVKPQFEAGREAIGKRGIVRDAGAAQRAVDTIRLFLEGAGWRVIGAMQSPLPGKEGNVEWLVGAVHGDG